ncbi:hypothetical protein GU927_015240 [Rhodobacteraceae bacterium HSP-20]|uniref:Calcium-binding protein n=1 Tax=Paragemmobacter amnigenus TaxID=2852097 RepID=A0ABS6J6N5_9RHOB|nr:hypothetical protein [Rhodobacter amnigenus]MBU9699205.1 hypothetical protein [Rhodobacter amnigenus]MBV4390432.1 hypothetical protein [Rhodobacter amnigenus]
MATITITGSTSGSVYVQNGDIVIIDPSAYGTYTLYAPAGSVYDVFINQNLPNSITFFTALNTTANAHFAPGVSAYNLDWGGVSGYGGTEVVQTGDGFRITNGGGYSMGAQSDTLILGQNNYVDNQIWMGDGQDTLVIGANSTVRGQINTQGGNGDVIRIGSGSTVDSINLGASADLAIGSNVTVNGYIYTGTSATAGDRVTLGDNTTVRHYIDLNAGNDTLDIGDGSTVVYSITADEGEDVLTIGDSVRITDYIDLGAGNDVLTIGDNVTVDDGHYGEIYGGAGNDSITIGDEADLGAYAWVYAGTGNDTLNLGVYNFANAGEFNGEGGTDTLNLTEGFGVSAQEIRDILSARGWRDADGDGVYEVAGSSFRIGNSWFHSWERVAVAASPDGVVNGTTGADVIGIGYVDAQGDQVDGTDGLDDVIIAGAGSDLVDGGLGNDTVFGGSGNDTVSGGDGDDVIRGDGMEPGGQVRLPLVTLTNTDNLQDSHQTEAFASRAVELVRLADGRLVMVTSENCTSTDGIALYEIDGNPASATFGRIINPVGSGLTNPDGGAAADLTGKISQLQFSAAGAGFDNIQSMEAVTLPTGETYVFTADVSTATIGIARIWPNGALTEGPSLTDTVRLDAVQSLSVVNVGGQPILLAYAGGCSDGLLSYAINPATGALTLLDREVDGNGLGENFLAGGSGEAPSFVEGFTNSAGQSFVLVAGNDGWQNGISLWTIDAAGQFTFQNARGDDQNGAGETDPQGNRLGRDLVDPVCSQTGLDDTAAAVWAEIGGRTYVFVGGNDDDVSIFRVDPDARNDGTFDLTLVGHVDNVLCDISALMFIPSGDSGTLVIGGEQSELRYFAVAVNAVTGVVTLDVAGSRIVDDAHEPGAELWDSEDLAYLDGVLVSASDNDHGVAVLTASPGFAAGSGMVEGAAGDDALSGGAGNDLLIGGGGRDTLTGGEGADTLEGGAGDDDLLLGAGDVALGGGGDDEFRFDRSVGGTAGITVVGGETAEEAVVDATNNPAGRIGDVLDLRDIGPVTVSYTNGDPATESGVATYVNDAGQTVVITFSEIETVLTSGDGVVDGTAGGDLMGPGFADLQGDQIDGTDGDDDVIASGAGDDTVDAGLGDDLVRAGDGDDAVFGNPGNDSLLGEDGSDSLDGGVGDDSLDGGAGADSLSGGEGADTLSGGDADDWMSGGEGNDLAFGGEGADVIDGDAGDDEMRGDGGDDVIRGGAGDDLLLGGEGGDTMEGGEGSDILSGEEGSDQLILGEGDDLAFGGAGDDSALAEAGNDTVFGGEGADFVSGGAGDDVIDTRSATETADTFSVDFGGPDADQFDDADLAFGDDGDDLILTGDDADQVFGGAGQDTIYSGFDGDLVLGEGGDDIIVAGEGADIVDGGDGADLIYGGVGPGEVEFGADDAVDIAPGNDADFLAGGAGNDTIFGGDDADFLSGGEGDDLLFGGLDADTIEGGTGDDIATGGAGADVFIFVAGGNLTVIDFEDGDMLQLGGFFSDLAELLVDFGDDGVINQSVGDFSDNVAMDGSLTLIGATEAMLTVDTTGLF